jgi:hypothetical protein
MFHVALVLMPITLLVVLGSMLLFGIIAVLAGMVGGTSAALLVKNKAVKRLLVIGFCILLLIGSLCLLPIVGVYAKFEADFIAAIGAFLFVFVGILAIFGVKTSVSIHNKIGRTVLSVIFSVLCIAAISLAVVTCVLALRY